MSYKEMRCGCTTDKVPRYPPPNLALRWPVVNHWAATPRAQPKLPRTNPSAPSSPELAAGLSSHARQLNEVVHSIGGQLPGKCGLRLLFGSPQLWASRFSGRECLFQLTASAPKQCCVNCAGHRHGVNKAESQSGPTPRVRKPSDQNRGEYCLR